MAYDDCAENAGKSCGREGPGGVKIVTTNPAGKTDAAGCPFVCRRRSRPRSDAALKKGREGGSNGRNDRRVTDAEESVTRRGGRQFSQVRELQ